VHEIDEIPALDRYLSASSKVEDILTSAFTSPITNLTTFFFLARMLAPAIHRIDLWPPLSNHLNHKKAGLNFIPIARKGL
jgi:hypothetical protein